MIPFMGYILLCYGVAAIAVHAMYRWHVHRHPKSVKRVHYVLITQNHENQMEWVLRALHWYCKMKGIALRVTLLDNESNDDTLAIAQKMQTHGMEITVVQAKDHQAEELLSRPFSQKGTVNETTRFAKAKPDDETEVADGDEEARGALESNRSVQSNGNVAGKGFKRALEVEFNEEKQFCIDLRLPQEVNQIPYVQV
ncbi:hypothetical protein ABE099_14885 [Paenibacillus turicensis]|uniref:hypothetical protein n=1 Tax=Paenibacillus turicensis TaxID=160487 RepID=UPI003D292A8D